MTLDPAAPGYGPETLDRLPQSGWHDYFRRFLRLAGPYWRGEARWAVRGLTAALLALTAGQVGIQIALNLWTEQLFDAFGKRSMAGFLELAGVFVAVVLGHVAIIAVHLRVRRRLEIGWRDWLTRKLIGGWAESGRQYLVDFVPGQHDNPDGRIAEDIRIATEYAIDLVHSLFYCVLLFVSFASILWTLSGPPELRLDGVEIWLPGHLLWAAILFAAVGTAIALLLGPPLVRAADLRQNREASFRFGLVRVRESALAVALLHGEADERRHLGRLFRGVGAAWDRQTDALTRFMMFTAAWSVLSPVFPVLIAAPRYIVGAITLGGLMQIAQAFQQAVAALSWPIDNLSKAAEWRASGERVLGLQRAIDAVADHRSDAAGRIAVVAGGSAALALRKLSIADPDGTLRIADIDLVVRPGERVLIAGDPGAAIRLFKAVAGLWPWGRGTVELPAGERVFFMPQRPYFPAGTLGAAVAYPAESDAYDRAAVVAALERVGLGHLAPRLDLTEAWEQTLGANDQQRIGFARLLLHRPRWILVQEATDALDAQGEAEMLDLLGCEFPAAAIVMIADHADGRFDGWRRLDLVKRGDAVYGRLTPALA